MPWWSWVLIWTVLGLALLGLLAVLGWRLFRKAMQAFAALGTLSEKLELLDAASGAVAPDRFTPWLLRDRDEIRDAHRILVDLRADRRNARREARRHRGKLLLTADLRGRNFPWESSATHSDGRT